MNSKIEDHKNLINNLSTEKDELIKSVWKFIVSEELKDDLKKFNEGKNLLESDILNLESDIEKSKGKQKSIENNITELEKKVTSIKPTISNINDILTSCGFTGFKLEESDDPLYYKIVRQDGSDASITISEGEKTFITFLYFHHLLKGSSSGNKKQINSDRVVVYDDPISSLDSNILHIVSSLIEETIYEVKNNKGVIKQIFILTHNIYFHKEVTHNFNRIKKDLSKQDKELFKQKFWIVRKINDVTKVESYEHNPIKTEYQLLWEQVKSSEKCSLTIQNTLRRILEYYFKIIGNMNFTGLSKYFDGNEKVIYKSLISWVNDGSHYPSEELYVSKNSQEIDLFINIFKKIFKESGHESHYNMMIGENLNSE